MAGRLNLVSAPAAAVSARQAGLTKGKTGSRVARKHAPVKNVDQEAVQQPEPQVRRTAWSFDHDAAEALYAHAQDTAVQFAKLEHNLPLAMRAFGKAIRAFVVTLMPDREIDTLRRRLTGQGVLHGNDVLPDDVVEFLLAKNLPLPHFNSLNPLQGIVAHFYQCARLSQQYTQPLEAQHEINVASRPLTADDLVGDEAKRLTAAQQTQQSKLARWVLAAVEMPEDLKAKTGGERLFDKGFPAAIEEWTEWREKNPYMVISTTKPKMVRKTKAEKEAEGRRREEQDEARRMQQTMAASGGLSEAPPDEVLGGDLTDTTTGESTSQAAETTAEKETVVEVPPAEPPVASEPKPIRWHSLLGDGGNYVRLSPEQAELLLGGDVLSALPDRGCLTFEVRDGSLVITGWEGADKV